MFTVSAASPFRIQVKEEVEREVRSYCSLPSQNCSEQLPLGIAGHTCGILKS